MKDIDFDELDKAVSSVLEPAAGAAPAKDAAKTEAVPVTTQPVEVPETPQEVPEAPTVEPASTPSVVVEAETPAAKMPLAIKRRGQFMDVVHPSSDMTGKPDEATAAPSRGVSLQPLSASVVPDTAPEATAPEIQGAVIVEPAVPIETPVESQPSVEAVEPAPADQTAPDPLDVMQAQEEAKDAADVETPNVEDTPVDATPAAEVAEEPAPSTPFLADTKVDKRPLDAFSTEEGETPAEPVTEPTAPVEPLPPELQADVVAVEANPSDHATETAEQEPTDDEQKESTETGTATSIPQQYASADAKADDDHSIFDTSEYHQPLAPTKVKKGGLPGWLVALIIMILLAGLSAAAGYFWFYYGL